MVLEACTRSRIWSAVRRDRLVRMLDEVLGGGVGTIVVGAGSGKSMLLSEWTRARADVASVTVDVDPRSADPTVFARRSWLRSTSGSMGSQSSSTISSSPGAAYWDGRSPPDSSSRSKNSAMTSS